MMPIRNPRSLGWRALVGALVTAAAPQASAPDTQVPNRAEGCEKPAYLVVVATITDPGKARGYLDALRAAGLYPLHAGFHITSGKSANVLEGEMFKSRPIVVAKFPCVEAARQFWYSDTYQKNVLPLRVGAGTFDVAIFEERIDEMRP